MAEYSLPSMNDVNDFLKSRGVNTDFASKSNLYSSLGLDKNNGKFVGSPQQNKAMQSIMPDSRVKTTTPKIPGSVQTLFDIGRTVKSPAIPPQVPTAPQSKPSQPIQPPYSASTPTQPIQPPYSNVPKDSTPQAPAAPATPSTGASKSYTTPSGAVVEVDVSGNTKLVSGPPSNPGASFEMSANEVIPGGHPDESTYINDFLSSADGQLLLDRASLNETTASATAEAVKQGLERKYASEKATLENNLASKGLAFSGIRGTQVKALADSLASSLLNADRTLASKLLDSDLDLREGVLKGVADLVKKAADDDKEAIAQLNKAGFAVVGNKLVPTMESQREARLAESAALADELSIARLENDTARLKIAEERLNVALREEARDLSKDVYNPGDYTASELRKLRGANIDPSDTEEGDDYLYGTGAARATLSVNQLGDIATGLLTPPSSSKDAPFASAQEAKDYINNYGIIEVQGKKIRLTEVQKEVLGTLIDDI